jgi:CHASE3 domain sensor protein
VLVMAAAVWAVGQIQASAERDSNAAISSGQQMPIAMLDQETGLRGFINMRDPRSLEPYRAGRAHFDEALTHVSDSSGDDADRSPLARQVSGRRWQSLAERELLHVQRDGKPTVAEACSASA